MISVYICTPQRKSSNAEAKRKQIYQRESSSVGRARPCQGRGREFESRLSLKSLLKFSRDLFLKGTIFMWCAGRRLPLLPHNKSPARVVELVDTQDLKSCSRKRSAGSIPALST